MDVYKIVFTVIALIVVTLLSVLAEMLGKAQETRRNAMWERRQRRSGRGSKQPPGDAMTSTVSRTRADILHDRDRSQPEARKRQGTDAE